MKLNAVFPHAIAHPKQLFLQSTIKLQVMLKKLAHEKHDDVAM